MNPKTVTPSKPASSAGKGSSSKTPAVSRDSSNINGHWERDENGTRNWVSTNESPGAPTVPAQAAKSAGPAQTAKSAGPAHADTDVPDEIEVSSSRAHATILDRCDA